MSYHAANADEQLVLDFFEVLSSGDLEKLRGFYHDSSVWEPKVKDIAGAGKHIGHIRLADRDEFGPRESLANGPDRRRCHQHIAH